VSYQQSFERLANHFLNRWELYNSDVPVAWGNTPFTPPAPPSPWVRFTVITGEADYISAGAPGRNFVRHAGLITVQVFVPLGDGDGRLCGLVDDVIPIFQGERVGENVWCGAAYAVALGESLSPGWLQANVNVPFHRDEIG